MSLKIKASVDWNDQFKKAFDLLEGTNRHAFITGQAGTGKSTFLEEFRKRTKKNAAVVAPTGVAAVNVKGQTIHSFFRFKPDVTIDAVEDIRLNKSQKEVFKNLETLIVDEVSMVRSDLLDCMDAFLRLHAKERQLPFGGVQMVFLGDLLQLPPIVTREEKDHYAQVYKSPYFFHSKVFGRMDIEYIFFEKIYRQEDEHFIALLEAVRNNNMSAEHLKTLNARFMPEFEPDENDFYVYLTTTNDMAEKINTQRLSRLKTKPYNLKGTINGDFDNRWLPTQAALELKYASQVMLLNNDPMGRWVNGSVGKVVGVNEDGDGINLVHVELTNGRRVDIKPFTWEMYRFVYNEKDKRLESDIVGSFTQYPLKLAWAVTIHKAQGKTFDKIIVDIGRGTFAYGQVYVALSRSTSLEGLILKTPIQKRHILTDARVLNFLNNCVPTSVDG